jgi:hypothetical protein
MKLTEQINKMKGIMKILGEDLSISETSENYHNQHLVDIENELKNIDISEDSKLHITHGDNIIKKTYKQDFEGFKPHGFWYSIGYSWLNWVKSEMPDFYGYKKPIYVFEIDTNKCNILKLSTFEEIADFHKKYSSADNKLIDWFEVSKKYDGIEFNPYIYKARSSFMWYYSLDVESGCIWNMNNLEYKLIYTNENKI